MRTFLVIVLIFQIFVPISVLAEQSKNIVDSFIDHGYQLMKRDDLSGALQYYSRALLLDPENEEAQGYLFELRSLDRLTARERINLIHNEDLKIFLSNLTKRRAYFAEKRDRLVEALISKGFPQFRLEQNLMDFQASTFQHFIAVEPVKLEENFLSTQTPLEAVNSMLKQNKQQLISDIALLEQQYQQLIDMNNQLFHKKLVREAERTSDKQTLEKVVAVEENPQIALREKDIVQIRDDLTYLQSEMSALKDAMIAKDKKVKELTDEVVKISLKFSEKEMLLTEKTTEAFSLDQELKDIGSRFELGQRIIQDKNLRIQSLKEGLEKMKILNQTDELNEIIKSKDEKLIEINGMLKIYKGKLADTQNLLLSQLGNMSFLEEQMTYLQVLILDKDIFLEETRKNLNVLEEKMMDMRMQFLKLKRKSVLDIGEKRSYNPNIGGSRPLNDAAMNQLSVNFQAFDDIAYMTLVEQLQFIEAQITGLAE